MPDDIKKQKLERKELSIIQKHALLPAQEKIKNAENQLQALAKEVLRELLIPEKEYPQWRFAEDFSFVEKLSEANQKGE